MAMKILAIIRTIINCFLFLMAIITENVITNLWALITHQYIGYKIMGIILLNQQHINGH